MLLRSQTPTTGGFRCIGTQNITDLSSSTQIFSNAPAGVSGVTVSIRGAIVATFDGVTTPVVDTHHEIVENFYTWQMERAELLKVRAIQSTPGSKVYITYWGG
jgi:hypothetical protein